MVHPQLKSDYYIRWRKYYCPKTLIMKKLLGIFSFLLLLHPFLFAQKENGEKWVVNVTKVTFIEPGLAHEFPLGRSSTFFIRGGMTVSLAADEFNEEIAGVLFRPFAAGSARVYYNFAKREAKEKNIERNSANYIALLGIVAGKPVNQGTDYDPNLNNSMLNAGIVWGMQRNYPSGFSLDLNIGIGYAKIGHTSGLSAVGEFNIGWCLGGKKK